VCLVFGKLFGHWPDIRVLVTKRNSVGAIDFGSVRRRLCLSIFDYYVHVPIRSDVTQRGQVAHDEIGSPIAHHSFMFRDQHAALRSKVFASNPHFRSSASLKWKNCRDTRNSFYDETKKKKKSFELKRKEKKRGKFEWK
jgi:hypothetical protein